MSTTPRSPSLLFVFVAACALAPAQASGQDRLNASPRSEYGGAPASWSELRARFLPLYREGEPPQTVRAAPDANAELVFETRRGVCYGVAAFAPGGEDIDVEVFEEGVFRGNMLSRDHYPYVEWCAEGTEVRVDVLSSFEAADAEVGLVERVNDSVEARLGESAVRARLRALWHTAAPTWRAQAPPTALRFEGPEVQDSGLETVEGCAAYLAAGETSILDLDLVLEPLATSAAPDAGVALDAAAGEPRPPWRADAAFRRDRTPVIVYCREAGEAPRRVMAGVRRGRGDAVLLVLKAPTESSE